MEITTLAAAAAVGCSTAVHLALMATFHVVFRRHRLGWTTTAGSDVSPSALGEDRVGFVSILKPLAGHDDDLDANLDSFAHLEGVRYEILFGVASIGDSALDAAEAFLERHPNVAARIIITDPSAALNPKVAQLIGLAAEARGDVLVTSDSNVRVARDYLVHLLAPFAEDARVGLATSLFAGVGEVTLGAALENLQLAATITPSVVLSTLGLPVTVGKSMAIRRTVLARIGGFESFGDLLAEDAMIGRRVAREGVRIATSFVPVENRNVGGSIGRMFERHSRWAKLRRAMSPLFFAIEPFFSPMLVALGAMVVAPSRTTLLLLALAMTVQMATSLGAAWTIRRRPMPWRFVPLEVVRAVLMLACWANAVWSRTVRWRGHPLLVGRDTVVTPLSDLSDATADAHPRPQEHALP